MCLFHELARVTNAEVVCVSVIFVNKTSAGSPELSVVLAPTSENKHQYFPAISNYTRSVIG